MARLFAIHVGKVMKRKDHLRTLRFLTATLNWIHQP
jgi:hypothetical protein